MRTAVLRWVPLALACAACRVAPAPEPVDALDSALTAEDFDATVRHLTALPWLPWAYTTDGCYGRALYYSMLLASKGVPTNHLYVVAQPGTQLGGIWRWHVAPLVTKDGDPNHLYVLDPVYDQTKALTNLEWVAHQNHTNPALGTYPSLHVYPGTSYQKPYTPVQPLVNPASPVAADYKEPTFEAMPKFAMSDVNLACAVMHRYIDREPGTTSVEKTQKHRSLGRETKSLVGTLEARGKIEGDASSLPANCVRENLTDPTEDAGSSVDGGTLADPAEPFIDPTRL